MPSIFEPTLLPPDQAMSPILKALHPDVGLAKTDHGVIAYFRHDSYIGRSLAGYGEYCGGEAVLLGQILPPGGVVVEAGANIGAHSVHLSQCVGARGLVYAFEPQRRVFQLLCANLALNGVANVIARQEGVGAEPGTLRAPVMDYSQSNNFGGVGLTEDQGEPVAITTIDSLALARLDLIKIDVEGMEGKVLQGAQDAIGRHRPMLYLENDRPGSQGALIRQVQALDYRLWWHLPPLFRPDNPRGVTEDLFPGVVSVNMLAVPRERPANIHQLREIFDDSPPF